MKKNINSNGFAHVLALFTGITVAIVVLTLTLTTNYLGNSRFKSLTFFGEPAGSVAGAMAPNGQIAAITKAECDIFVALNGNNSNNGRSETSPMQDISNAVNAAQAGEAVCIKGGEYRQVVTIKGKRGTSAAPIKVGGYVGGGLPIISGGNSNGDEYKLPDPTCKLKDICDTERGHAGRCARDTCSNQTLFSITDSSYMHVIGIDVRGSSGRGFALSDSNYMYVKGLRSYHNWDTGVQVASNTNTTGIRNDLELLAVYDNLRAMPENGQIGGGAIHVNKIKGGSIKKSLVFQNFGEGLDVHMNSSNVTVSESMFWDNFHAFLYPNGSINTTLNGNFLFCTGNRVKWLVENGVKPGSTTGYGTAITVRNEKGVTAKHGEGYGTIVSNNIVAGCTESIIVAAQTGANLTDVKILNNTVVSPRNYPSGNGYAGKNGGSLSISGSVSNIVVANNVFLADSTGGSISGTSANNATYSNNIVSKAGSVSKPGVRVINPAIQRGVSANEVLNPATIDASSFTIASGSPAIDAGQAVANARNTIDKDFFGNPRNANALDAGAYEFGAPKNWSNLYRIIMSGAPTGGGDDVDIDGDVVPNSSDVCPNTHAGANPDPARPGCPLDVVTPPTDTDGDGVPNSLDQCPNRAAGANPDPARPGCPLPNTPIDSDGDGVPNNTDQCPETPASANPNPARPGCPLDIVTPPADTDGDGVADIDDECPSTPAGTNPDAERLGCPLEEAEPEANLILNGNFKEGPLGLFTTANNWSFTKGQLGNAAASISRARQTDIAKGEVFMISVSSSPLGTYPAIHQKGLMISPNTSYKISFVAKASMPGNAVVEIRDMNLIETRLVPKMTFVLSQEYRQYTATVTSGSFNAAKAAKVTFGFRVPNGTRAYIDNIVITPVR